MFIIKLKSIRNTNDSILEMTTKNIYRIFVNFERNFEYKGLSSRVVNFGK